MQPEIIDRRFAAGERVRTLVGQRVTYTDQDVEQEDGDGTVSFHVPKGTTAQIVRVRHHPTPFPYVLLTDDDREFGVREDDIERVAG